MISKYIYCFVFLLISGVAVNCKKTVPGLSSSSANSGASSSSSLGGGSTDSFSQTNPGFGGGSTGSFPQTNPGFGGAPTGNFPQINPGYGGFGGSPNFGNYGGYHNRYPYAPSAPQGFQTPFAPRPLLSPEEFNLSLQQYLYSLQQQYETLYRQHQQYVDQWRDAQGPAYYGPNYSYATGSYTPNEIHQTAGISPPNPGNPNIDSRFGPEDSSQSDKPNFVGVSTSSFSSSSDVDGVKSSKQGAVTTVNDNGKVTTYKVGS